MNLPASIRQILDALAYAYAGDYLSLSQKHAVLSGTSTVARVAEFSAPAAKSSQARIGLYLGSELSEEVMQYVTRTCVEMHYQLTILTLQSQKDTEALLAPYRTLLDASDLKPTIVTLSGDPLRGLTTALRRQPDIAFLVCNETGYLGRSMLNGTQNQLPVPVVLVTHASRHDARGVQPAQTSISRAA